MSPEPEEKTEHKHTSVKVIISEASSFFQGYHFFAASRVAAFACPVNINEMVRCCIPFDAPIASEDNLRIHSTTAAKYNKNKNEAATQVRNT